MTLMPPEFLMEQGDAINEYLLQPIAKQKATEYLYEKMRDLIGSLKTPIRQILLHLPSNFMVNQVLNMMSKRIFILSALNEPELDNKTLFNIAQMRHKPVLDTAFEMIIKNQSQITIAPVVMTFKDIDNFLLDLDRMLGSDLLIIPGLKPHPRAYGALTRFAHRYVIDKHRLSWEEAIYKMTGLPAQKFHLSDRGQLIIGAKADIVLFNPNTLQDQEQCRILLFFPMESNMY